MFSKLFIRTKNMMSDHWKWLLDIFSFVIDGILVLSMTDLATKQFTMAVLYGSICFVIAFVVVCFLNETFNKTYYDLIADAEVILAAPWVASCVVIMLEWPYL